MAGNVIDVARPTRRQLRDIRIGAFALAYWLGVAALGACTSAANTDADDSLGHCFEPTTEFITEEGDDSPVKSYGPIDCEHYHVLPGDCSEHWSEDRWLAKPLTDDGGNYFIRQRALKPEWMSANTAAVAVVGRFFLESGFRPAYRSVEIATSQGTASLGMAWQWLEYNPLAYPKDATMAPCAASYYIRSKINASYNREWLDSKNNVAGGQALVPPCCGRVHCDYMSFAFFGDETIGGCGESFALVWEPEPGGATQPACVRLTFHPQNRCDPDFGKTIFTCNIKAPNDFLDFAICFNSATPASVGWDGVKQVELAPLALK